MTQLQINELKNSEIIEITDDLFIQCNFNNCEFTGTGGSFLMCVFKDCSFVNNRMRCEFDQCAFGGSVAFPTGEGE